MKGFWTLSTIYNLNIIISGGGGGTIPTVGGGQICTEIRAHVWRFFQKKNTLLSQILPTDRLCARVSPQPRNQMLQPRALRASALHGLRRHATCACPRPRFDFSLGVKGQCPNSDSKHVKSLNSDSRKIEGIPWSSVHMMTNDPSQMITSRNK